MPVAALCAVVLVWPVCLAIHRGAEVLLDAEATTGDVYSLSPYNWPCGLRASLAGRQGPLREAFAVREACFAMTSILCIGPACYLSLCREEVATRRRMLCALSLSFVATFATGLAFASAVAGNVVTFKPPELEPLVRSAFHSATFVPAALLTMMLPFPSRLRWKVGLRVALCSLGSMVCGFGWRALCAMYFHIGDRLVRVVVGVLVPKVLAAVGFECFYAYALLLLKYRDLQSAVLWLVVPLGFAVSSSAALQIGAPDLATGVVMEIGSLLVELRWKRSLLHGKTPLQDNVQLMKAVLFFVTGRPSKSAAAVVPIRSDELQGVVPTDASPRPPMQTPPVASSPAPAVHPMAPSSPRRLAAPGPAPLPRGGGDCAERSEASAPSSPRAMATEATTKTAMMTSATSGSPRAAATTTSMVVAADRLQSMTREDASHFNLLLAVALNSNIIEMVVHVTVGAFFVLGRLNPNDASGKPTPHAQVLSLLLLKVGCELVTDCATAAWASRLCAASRTKLQIMEGFWTTMSWTGLACIFVLSFTWAMETQMTFVFHLCPSPDASSSNTRVGSLGLCPARSFV